MTIKTNEAASAFEKFLRTAAYKDLLPDAKLTAMLKFKPFDQLLEDGNIFNVEGASQRVGYTTQHVRRLCREDRLPHLTRGLTEAEVHIFFLPEQLDALFTYRKSRE